MTYTTWWELARAVTKKYSELIHKRRELDRPDSDFRKCVEGLGGAEGAPSLTNTRMKENIGQWNIHALVTLFRGEEA